MEDLLKFLKENSQLSLLLSRHDCALPLELIKKIKSHKDGLFWLQSSGSERHKNQYKFIAHTKQSLLCAAESVVDHFGVTQKDIFLNSLPKYHIAGIMSSLRSYVSGSREILLESKWCANNWYKLVNQQKITIASLVPTQLYDIAKKSLKAPDCMRLILVGGGAISLSLEAELQKLGWPMVHTLGMSETAAMYAYKKKIKDEYLAFKHVDLSVTSENEICVRSEALFNCIANISDGELLILEREEDVYQTSDLGRITENGLVFYGRKSRFVKINGVSVALDKMQSIWDGVSNKKAILHYQENERHGAQLIVVSTEEVLKHDLEAFNTKVDKYLHIKKCIRINSVPRSHLGKVLWNELEKLIKNAAEE